MRQHFNDNLKFKKYFAWFKKLKKKKFFSRFHDLEHQNHQLRTEIEQKSAELHQLYNQHNDNEGYR